MAAISNVQKTYTITFGDVSENHAGMVKQGKLHASGYSLETLEKVQTRLEAEGVECELYALHEEWPIAEEEVEEAHLLVIRKGVQYVLKTATTAELMAENDALAMDKYAFMKGRVVNKHARWNLCFGEEYIAPHYETGQGTVIPFESVPLVQKMREAIASWTDDVLLEGEANYYYDISKCGIGFHGDGERKKVFAMRMGAPMPIYFQWFQRSAPVGNRMQFDLFDGDMYIMSEKAVGFDWLKKIVPTLRHATGCDKYTKL